MIFAGTALLGATTKTEGSKPSTAGDKTSSYVTPPTMMENVGSVRLSDAVFYTLYVTNETDESQRDYVANGLPMTGQNISWDRFTVMVADFEGNCEASQIANIKETSHILLRRRESESDDWHTVSVRVVNDASDYLVTYYDRFNKSGTQYQYVLVPIVSGQPGGYLPGNMTDFVESVFHGIYVADKDVLWGTPFDPSYTKNRIRETNVVTTLASRYPVVVSNGGANYDAGTASGLFVPYIDGSGRPSDIDLKNGLAYRDSFYDFLTDGRPKIFKTFDGLIKIVQIDGEISEDNSEFYLTPITSFNWVEIGDVNSYEDMDANGLLEYVD